jgi:hypothetical protein
MMKRAIEFEDYVNRLAAEHAEFAAGDFIGFSEEGMPAIVIQDLFELLVVWERE